MYYKHSVKTLLKYSDHFLAILVKWPVYFYDISLSNSSKLKIIFLNHTNTAMEFISFPNK
jgi:hypothetical protein